LRELVAMAGEADEEDWDEEDWDEEDWDEDEDEPDGDEPGLQPEQEATGEPEPDAANPAACEADEEEDDDLSDMTYEEFERDILAGPFGEIDDDWEDEDVQVPDSFDVEAHARLLARLIEAHGLGRDATRGKAEADAGTVAGRSGPLPEAGESAGT
jgi:hypothetical protein